MKNTVIAKSNIQNYAVLDGYISKKGITKETINTKNGPIDKVSFSLITRDISDRICKLFNIKQSEILRLLDSEGKPNLMCIRVEALSYTAKFCKSLKPNSRIQILGEFKNNRYNGRNLLYFLLSTAPSEVKNSKQKIA